MLKGAIHKEDKHDKILTPNDKEAKIHKAKIKRDLNIRSITRDR